MDVKEIVEGPLQAVQHPFVYDAKNGFRVRVGRGKEEEALFARMKHQDLHRHITEGTSPTGNSKTDTLFYAAHLVHYGLPADYDQHQAVQNLAATFNIVQGKPVLPVPQTVSAVLKRLKKEYESMTTRLRAIKLLAGKEVELAEAVEALQTHQTTLLHPLQEERTRLAEALLLTEKRLQVQEQMQIGLKEKIKDLERIVNLYKSQANSSPSRVSRQYQQPVATVTKTETDTDMEIGIEEDSRQLSSEQTITDAAEESQEEVVSTEWRRQPHRRKEILLLKKNPMGMGKS
jgi:hypothetical protein